MTLVGEPGEIVLWMSGRDASQGRVRRRRRRRRRRCGTVRARRLSRRAPRFRLGGPGRGRRDRPRAGRFLRYDDAHRRPVGPEGRPFGTVLAAMVTPFTATGELDVAATGQLAEKLVDDGNDGLVVNGTTGESPTTTDAEKERSSGRWSTRSATARPWSPGSAATTPRTRCGWRRRPRRPARTAALVVTPYYSRPQQDGLLAHFAAVADASDLPIMLYDIPPRSVVAIEPETLLRLAEHPRITAVKDAKGDLLRRVPGDRRAPTWPTTPATTR